MKRIRKGLVISITTMLLLSGILVVSGGLYQWGRPEVGTHQSDDRVNIPSLRHIELLCPYEGNTPGFWKNHLDLWVGYTPSQKVNTVFKIPSGPLWYLLIGSKTLLQALSFKGGPGIFGKARILIRAAVAGLLNAAHPDVNYLYTYNDLQYMVNDSLSRKDPAVMILRAKKIDVQNNLGSDL